VQQGVDALIKRVDTSLQLRYVGGGMPVSSLSKMTRRWAEPTIGKAGSWEAVWATVELAVARAEAVTLC
jgi:hypothetical protein